MLLRLAGLLGICVIAVSPAPSSSVGDGTMMLSPAVVATWFTDQQRAPSPNSMPAPRLPPQSAEVSSGGTAVVSPTVVATEFRVQPPGKPVRLQLLVLWRGTPGWFLNDNGSSGGSGGGSASGTRSETIKRGGLFLQVSLHEPSRVVTIQDQPIELKEDNVVLVDDVDSPAGARVVGQLRLGPDITDPGQFALIKTSPRLVEFLRCDAKSPTGRGQAMLDPLCERVLGITR